MSDEIIVGRNSVTEALRSGRSINKLLVQDGIKGGSIGEIINLAKEKRVLEKRGVLMDLTILVVGLILGVGIPLRNKAIKKRRENMKEKGNEEK